MSKLNIIVWEFSFDSSWIVIFFLMIFFWCESNVDCVKYCSIEISDFRLVLTNDDSVDCVVMNRDCDSSDFEKIEFKKSKLIFRWTNSWKDWYRKLVKEAFLKYSSDKVDIVEVFEDSIVFVVKDRFCETRFSEMLITERKISIAKNSLISLRFDDRNAWTRWFDRTRVHCKTSESVCEIARLSLREFCKNDVCTDDVCMSDVCTSDVCEDLDSIKFDSRSSWKIENSRELSMIFLAFDSKSKFRLSCDVFLFAVMSLDIS